MKHLLIATLFLCLAGASASAQAPSVRTPEASNKYFSFRTAGTDTVSTDTTDNYTKVKYLYSLVFGKFVADDTIIVRNGSDTVVNFIVPSTAPAGFTLPIMVHVDSNYVSIIRKKTTDGALIYRQGY